MLRPRSLVAVFCVPRNATGVCGQACDAEKGEGDKHHHHKHKHSHEQDGERHDNCEVRAKMGHVPLPWYRRRIPPRR